MSTADILDASDGDYVYGLFQVEEIHYRTLIVIDENGEGLAVYTTESEYIKYTIGDLIFIEGERDTHMGLSQVGFPDITLISDYPVDIDPYEALEFNITGWNFSDNTTMLAVQSNRINLDEVVITDIGKDNFNNLVGTFYDASTGYTINMRFDRRMVGADDIIDAIINAYKVGDVVNLKGVIVDWRNGARLVPTDVDQFEATTLSDANFYAHLDRELEEVLNPGDDLVDDVILLDSYSFAGRSVTVTWTSDDHDIIDLDGKVTRPVAGEDDAEVVLEATVTDDNGYNEKFTYNVTVLTDTSTSVTLKPTTGEGSTTVFMEEAPVNNANLVNLDESIFTVTSQQNDSDNTVSLDEGEGLRLYPHRQSGDGTLLTVTISSGYRITGVAIEFGNTGFGQHPSNAKMDLVLGDSTIVITSDNVTNRTETHGNLDITSFSMKNTQDAGAQDRIIIIISITITYEQIGFD